MSVNRLITRGMGRSRGRAGRAGMVTQGYGGFLQQVTAAVSRVINVGQSGTKRALKELEEVVVWAKLIRVNDEKPKSQIHGQINVKVNITQRISVMAKGLSTRVRSALEDIKISIKRLK